MILEIGKYRAVDKPSLKAFFDLHIVDMGMVIHDMKLFHGEKGPWIKLPDREYKSKEGETKYQYVVSIPNREKSNEFQALVLAALQKHKGSTHDSRSEPTSPKISVDPSPDWNDLPF